ncbi:MAG: hypothetical protein DLM50_07525 [Candidatus Meridianibacter frigidus]|nr:MAG: hypothetical protein DLM50_07525 [Candidatus Eremiobacteraeota bacterium]
MAFPTRAGFAQIKGTFRHRVFGANVGASRVNNPAARKQKKSRPAAGGGLKVTVCCLEREP